MIYGCPSLILLLFLALCRLPWAAARVSQLPLIEASVDNVQSAGKPFTRERVFEFDINWRSMRSSDYFVIDERVRSSSFSGEMGGGVKLVPGHASQQNDTIILDRVTSSDEQALDTIAIESRNDTYHGVYITSVDTAAPPNHGPDLAIDIFVFIKPQTLQFAATSIQTANLNIEIWPDLRFETYDMYLWSGKSVAGLGTYWDLLVFFIAFILWISTIDGPIKGNWSLPSSVTFETVSGNVDVDLFPKQWSAGPSTTGDLSARSRQGNVTIRMPLESGKRSLRNGTTRVEAPNGHISGTFVHSTITSLVALGSINVTLLPYSAFSATGNVQLNYITTESKQGNTSLKVLEPVIDSYYKINPLFFTVSRHHLGSGQNNNMWISYPGQWGGTAVGRGRSISITGGDFEVVETNSTYMKATRRPLGSDLLFTSEANPAELVLEECKVLDCGWPAALAEEL